MSNAPLAGLGTLTGGSETVIGANWLVPVARACA